MENSSSGAPQRRRRRPARAGGGNNQQRSRFRGAQGNRRRSGGGNSRGRNRRRKPAGIPVERFINRNPKAMVTEAPKPIVHTFNDFGFLPRLERAIAKRGYVTPTPIQDQMIPFVLRGRDVIGLANTGTGKTATFLLPLINRALLDRYQTALILAPTRELAVQINDELRSFVAGMPIYSTVCVGGTSISPQIRQLKRPQHFIVGTPGRVIDLMKQGALDLSGVQTIVLDEADRMLDMGFIGDMRYVMSHMPENRNTLFFSATMSPEIEALVHDFLNNPEIVSVVISRTSDNIAQDVVRIEGRDKVAVLSEILDRPEVTKVIVFGRTKYGVDKLGRKLKRAGFAAESIHGNKSHAQRKRALDRFKKGEVSVLVATDVAARGIDVPMVSHVINFDVPMTYDDYVHRIGRTGRGDQEGMALTFVE